MRPLGPVLVLLLSLNAASQENANPWLNQREFFGQATFTIRGGGSTSKGGSAGYKVDRYVHIDFRIQFDVNLARSKEAMKQLLSGPNGANLAPADRKKMEEQLPKYYWVPENRKKEQTRQIHINDFSSSGSESIALKGADQVEEKAATVLIIDISTNTFDLVIGLNDAVEVTETVQGKKPSTGKGLQGIGKTMAKIEEKKKALPSPGGSLFGSVDISKELERFRPSSDYGEIEGTLDWVLSPKPFEPLELVLDIDGYDQWLPNAGAGDNEDGPDQLKIVASLKNKGGGAITDKIESLTFVLCDVSDEPGIACNWPLRPKQGEKVRDLWFPREANAGLTRIRDQGLVVRAVKPGTTATAVIASRDWGAWGTLHADAILESGRRLDGFTPSLPKNPRIPIPKRSKDSRIADAWKKDPYKTHPDDWDGEDEPSGKATMDGDGLTLYEEYRGFIVNGKHVHGDPTKKDFFILDLNHHPKIQKGITLFASLTGLRVHSDLKPEELGIEAPAKRGTRRINANSREVKVVDQHGVVIEPFDDTVDVAGAHGPGAKKDRTTPKDYLGIKFPSKAAAEAPTLLKRPKQDRQGADVFPSVIAHELLHTVNVPHHGDDDVFVHWVIKKDASGAWTMTEDGMPVTMVLEDGTPFPFTKEADTKEARLGIPGGKYSGNEECVMRYFNADAYKDPNNERVRINVRGDDAPGDQLCSDKAGTGTNAPAWVNGGRFRDAKTGNCKSFICVNDLYK